MRARSHNSFLCNAGRRAALVIDRGLEKYDSVARSPGPYMRVFNIAFEDTHFPARGARAGRPETRARFSALGNRVGSEESSERSIVHERQLRVPRNLSLGYLINDHSPPTSERYRA